MIINSKEWKEQMDTKLFYQELRAMLDGIECGQGDKSLVTQLCRRNGYRFNWEDYSLETLS